jgi:hypothetical protein
MEDMNHPLANIQKAVANVIPGGIQESSVNQRELKSRYFLPKGKTTQYEYAEMAPRRAYAHVTILGDRRPYEVVVRVFIENRAGFGPGGRRDPIYDEAGQDDDLAAALAQGIKEQLIKGRENRNLIDDFRPF